MRLQPQPQPSSRYRQAQSRRCARGDCQQEGLFPAPSDRETKNSRAWLCLEHARAANNAWNYYEHKSNEDIEQDLRDSAVGYRPTWPMNPSGKRNGNIWGKRGYEKQEGGNSARKNCEESFANIFIDIFGENPNKNAQNFEREQAREDTQENIQEKNQENTQEKNFDALQNSYDNDHRIPRNREERKACRVLELTPPINAKELKARYRALAKAHHPDHHIADLSAEKLKNKSLANKNLAKNPDEQTRQQKQERLKQINVAYSLLQGLWSRQATS